MSDKTLPERIGIVETEVAIIKKNYGDRLVSLEAVNDQEKKTLIKAMWFCIKLLFTVTILTLVTEKMRDHIIAVLGVLLP